ncbi:hypothetical protein SNEBB_007495 [Seison nebaliae]|nr:hypothetical protein SNEBB_007495 [Seison nebaliae]
MTNDGFVRSLISKMVDNSQKSVNDFPLLLKIFQVSGREVNEIRLHKLLKRNDYSVNGHRITPPIPVHSLDDLIIQIRVMERNELRSLLSPLFVRNGNGKLNKKKNHGKKNLLSLARFKSINKQLMTNMMDKQKIDNLMRKCLEKNYIDCEKLIDELFASRDECYKSLMTTQQSTNIINSLTKESSFSFSDDNESLNVDDSKELNIRVTDKLVTSHSNISQLIDFESIQLMSNSFFFNKEKSNNIHEFSRHLRFRLVESGNLFLTAIDRSIHNNRLFLILKNLDENIIHVTKRCYSLEQIQHTIRMNKHHNSNLASVISSHGTCMGLRLRHLPPGHYELIVIGDCSNIREKVLRSSIDLRLANLVDSNCQITNTYKDVLSKLFNLFVSRYNNRMNYDDFNSFCQLTNGECAKDEDWEMLPQLGYAENNYLSLDDFINLNKSEVEHTDTDVNEIKSSLISCGLDDDMELSNHSPFDIMLASAEKDIIQMESFSFIISEIDRRQWDTMSTFMSSIINEKTTDTFYSKKQNAEFFIVKSLDNSIIGVKTKKRIVSIESINTLNCRSINAFIQPASCVVNRMNKSYKFNVATDDYVPLLLIVRDNEEETYEINVMF